MQNVQSVRYHHKQQQNEKKGETVVSNPFIRRRLVKNTNRRSRGKYVVCFHIRNEI